MTHIATSPRFKENAKAALADAELQNALTFVAANFIARRREAADAAARVRGAARRRARHQGPHARASRPLSRSLRGQGAPRPAATCTAPRRRRRRATIVLDICQRGRRQHRHQGQVDDRRGDRPQRPPRGERHRRRSRPISANTSSSSATRSPCHIIAPAVHLTKDAGRGRLPPRPHASAGRPRSHRADAAARRGARRAAREVPRRRCRHHRRQLPGRRDRHLDHRHQRGQRRPHPDPAQGRTSCSPRSRSSCRRSRTSSQILRVLARSATGQEMSVYTTLLDRPAPRRTIPTGRSEYHVVILDNGRSAMLGGEFQDMLRCIRCGACMNHCPVYHAVGGHAYGWVYPGPMGAVLTPTLIGVDKAGHLPNASTFCGRCEEVCPVRIPLPKMMRHWREREFERHLSPATVRAGLGFWAFFARRPRALPASRPACSRRALALVGRAQGPLRARCRSPAAGPAIATFPARRARPSRRSGRRAGGRRDSSDDRDDERARPDPRRDPPLARRHRPARRRAAGGRGPHRRPSARRHSGARAGLAAGAARPVRPHGRARGRQRRARRRARRGAGARSPPSCAATICRRRCGAAPIRCSPACRGSAPARSRSSRPHRTPACSSSVSHAFAGVAETGTLVLASGTDNPTTLNFLPDNHIVVVDAKDVGGRLRDGLAAAARQLRRRPDAAHRQPDHRPVALRRHRADADPRRARPAPAARDRGGRGTGEI